MSYTSIYKNKSAYNQYHFQRSSTGIGGNPDLQKDSMTNSINHMMNNSYTYNYNPKYRVTRLPNPPSFLHHGALKFVIMDAPTDDNLATYIKVLFFAKSHIIYMNL